jgi:hypothetical protein
MNRSVLDNLTPESRKEAEKALIEMKRMCKKKEAITKAKASVVNEPVPQKTILSTNEKEGLNSWLGFAIAVNYKPSELAQWLDENSEDEAEVEEDLSPINPEEIAEIDREIRKEALKNAKLGLSTLQTVTSNGKIITEINRPLKSDREISENRKLNCPQHTSCLDLVLKLDWRGFSCINCPLFGQKP